MARVHNFSAGPAALPVEVLSEVADELLDYRGNGMSVLEMSHRSRPYSEIIEDAEATLRRLMGIPSGYRVLFLQGGATLQFSGIPMNLMRTRRAGYVVSGLFSRLAKEEAQRYGEVEVLASSEDTGFDRIPDLSAIPERTASGGLDYVYICQNNTVFGTMFHELPQTGEVPLVADISSCFLSAPIDVERYGLLYAGAQKNAGIAGVTVVIVRDDLAGDAPALDCCPSYMNYRRQADAHSMMNTPNTFGIYLSGKVFRWVEERGGLAAMERANREKADVLYGLLDRCRVLRPTAETASRSISNVTFRTGSDELDAEFVAGARERGIEGVKGHRLAGGMRASIYNAVTIDAVRALAAYMEEFDDGHARDPRAAAAGHRS